MKPYEASYSVGSLVRVADRQVLAHFAASWKHHDPLTDEQLGFWGIVAKVAKVGFYHGGDVLYQLEDVPGVWHEECLEKANETPGLRTGIGAP